VLPLSVSAQGSAPAVTIYDATELAHGHYTVLRRLGVEGRPWWRRMPVYGDADHARQALVAEAAQIGAHGLINVYCVSKVDGPTPREGYHCYANAIRLDAKLARPAP